MKGRAPGLLKLHTKSKVKGMNINYTLNCKNYKKMCIGTINLT